jgi:antitoxin VapB
MALNIKNPETERLARELARRRGGGITEAVTHALRNEVERERRRPSRGSDLDALLRDLDAITRRIRRLPVLDTRSPDEIVGYNRHGQFD